MRVIRFADINHTGVDTFYYYLRLKKQCLEKISGIDYKALFSDIHSTDNIWNMSDNKSDKEVSLSKEHTDYSENVCFVISKLWT